MMTLPSAIAPLAEFRRWVGWRWITLPNGKRDKPPFRADFPEFHASTTKPNSWTSFATAAAAQAAGKLDGIGYVCTDDADRVYVDLDKCRNPITGEIADWAVELVEECDSYTEITPSGAGLRIIGTHGGALKAPIHATYQLPGGGRGEVFFRAARYITVTGNRLPGTPDELRDICGPVLDLLARAGKAHAAQTAQKADSRGVKNREDAMAPIADVRAALAVIPNPDVPYDDWVRTGLATFAATGGTSEGFEAWQAWSAKSGKHQDAECLRVWRSFERSPPKRIGFGSLCYLARTANPLFMPPSWLGKPEPTQRTQNTETIDWSTGEILPAAQSQARTLPLIYFEDVKPNLDAADFVEGLLIEGAMSVVYGPSNCGKTFFMTDLALHVAAGRPWRGKAIEQGGVIYCALEGSHGISNRIAAFKHENGLEGVALPFAVVPVAINLLDPNADRASLVATIQAAAARMGCPIKLIVIDTLSRALAGGNENAPDDMGALVASADYIRQATTAHLAFVHHSGKDQAQGARGHSLLRAATDTEIEISRADSASPSVAKVTKQRELEIEGLFVFRLRTVKLGKNRRGKPVTSCVVEHLDENSASAVRLRLPPGAKAGLDALREALIKAGQTPVSRDIPKWARVVSLEAWRREFYARSHLESADARKKAFQRAIKDLREAGHVAVMHDQAWITDPHAARKGGGT